ncbi:MAG: hypothetical protein K0U98_06850 [Deltaproteobacteria bacterium]|nr:hypothetical protein [Deltaproteobacteria bacterium]
METETVTDRPPTQGEFLPPWEIPAEAFKSQRLYRFHASGKGGRGRFRLTLRLASPDRFQLSATDPLGRSLWSLHFRDRKAILIEHREKRSCHFDETIDLSELYLGSFPLRFLPAVLLGRVPGLPQSALEPLGEPDGPLSFVDSVGQRWSVALNQGTVVGWTLEDPAGEIVAILQRESGGWSVLEEPRRQLKLRWREVVREPLEDELEAPEVPPSYREGGCLAEVPVASFGSDFKEGFDTSLRQL